MNHKLIADILQEMIACSEGNLHDIAHLVKVHAFAQTIGIQEGLPDDLQQTLEIAAIVHDIACPLCRKKYGRTDGFLQEQENAPLTEAFLERFELPDGMPERITYLVCHHHTYTNVDGLDYQILLEADFLVNADEGKLSTEAIRNARAHFFKTQTGTALLNAIYLSEGTKAL